MTFKRTALAGLITLAALGASPAMSAAIPAVTTGPAMLGTTPVMIRGDRFSESWRHASADASTSPLMRALVGPAMRLTPAQKLAYVQSVVTTNIRWASDTTLWGRHDYWASAAETLQAGAGDSEDRAILKMQALKNLGFSPNDLFLTMARDSVGGPMTVLSVRMGRSFMILADTGHAFLADSRRSEFQPLISLGSGHTWLHLKPRTAPAKAPSIVAASYNR